MNDIKLLEILEQITILIGRLGNGQNVHYDGLAELWQMVNELKREQKLKEKQRLQEHLDAGKDVLVSSELNWVRERIKEIDSELR